MEKVAQSYTVGWRVTGEVEKLLPYGIFVRLRDGTRAYVRRRELTWAADVEPWRIVQPGERIEAVVLSLADGERSMELSVKALQTDPWADFVRDHREGDVVTGTVKHLRLYGAYVEIVPGVNGLVPISELVAWDIEKTEEVVWVDDDVEAVITHIGHKARTVHLSVRRRATQLARAAQIMKMLDQRSLADQAEQGEVESLPPQEAQKPAEDGSAYAPICITNRIGAILVVDDHDEVCEPLVKWLNRRGHQADAAHTAEEAVAAVSRRRYDVLIVDINLPAGMNGLALLRQIRPQLDGAQAVVMSIPEWLNEHNNEIEALGAVGVLVKPLDVQEIENLLTKIEQGETLPPWKAEVNVPEPVEEKPFQEFTEIAGLPETLSTRLRVALEQLVENTGADAGVVFGRDPISEVISVLAQTGTATFANDTVYSLRESPVRDVICEQRYVFENHASETVPDRFRKLLEILSFESCIGVPITSHGETRHALFLFDSSPNAFARYRLRDALATATLCAALIEREVLAQQVQSLSKFLLSGRLAAIVGHEMYNKMSGLEIQIDNLRTDCKLLKERIPALRDSGDLENVKAALDALFETKNELRQSIDLFRDLMETVDEGTLNVANVLQHAVAHLRMISGENHFHIHVDPDLELPPVAGSEIRLRHVFLNAMQNAVQQMAASPSKGGTLSISAACRDGENGRRIQIRFQDTGPGIHKRLWEKVFSLGFSTRQGGTGLGLFIARSLVESLGGRILVEQSVIPIGTTFLVELPAAVPPQKE